MVALDYRQEWILADYPLEQGAFETYDKVATPFEARVRFSSGGSALDRQALLTSIAGTIDIFTVITPEVIYPNVNVVHYDYRRAADRGVGLIAVDVFLRQVRVQSVPAFSNTQQPNGADQTGGGSVQTKAPTPTEGTVAGTNEPAPSVGNSCRRSIRSASSCTLCSMRSIKAQTLMIEPMRRIDIAYVGVL